MKKISIVLGLLALIFCIVKVFGSGTAWGDDLELTASSCGSGCFTFTVNYVPAHPDGYSYYWFFDDGSYAITSVNTINHTFQAFLGSGTSANRTVRVEVTRLYEKGDKPARTIMVNPGGGVPEPETLSVPLSIVPNRTPVPGDSVTYVVSYGRSCEGTNSHIIELYYDPLELTAVEAGGKGYHQESINFSTVGKVVITLSSSSFDDDRSRRVFLPFEVRPEVQEHQIVGISGNIFLDNRSSCLSGDPVTAYQAAQLSHDPNYIVANTPMVCDPVSGGQKVRYTIHFQNTGQAPADVVEVRTWLPKFFSETAVYQIHPVGPSSLLPVNNGEIVWQLSGPTLKSGAAMKGTGEPGYGAIFFEEDTKDSIVYEVAFDLSTGAVFAPCQAIVNRAEIVFDCNPSIHTNFYQTVIGCQLSGGGNCFCDTLSGQLITSDTLAFIGADVLLDVSGTGPASVVWYPPVHLDPFSSAPMANPPRSIDYMASLRKDGCSYDLAHFRVEQNCDLIISAKVNYRKCKGGVLADIEAEAVTSGSAANLVWNWECSKLDQSKSGHQFTLKDRGPGVYHLTVKDTQTGCWAETVVVVQASCSRFPWKPAVIGAALVLAGLVFFFVFRKK